MSLISDFINKINKLFLCLKGAKSYEIPPQNLVRLCKSRSEFIIIINMAINSSGGNWDKEIIDNTIKLVLQDQMSEISVYKSDTLDCLDYGHALGVIAEGICQDDFRFGRAKRKQSCTRGSLLIPVTCLPESANYKLTPKNNLDFYPANNHHYDLEINDSQEFALAILNGIKQGTISWTFLGNDGKCQGTYKLQSAIAYSHCLQTFGKLNPNTPPSDWVNGRKLTASEQIETLMHLAQINIIDSPTSNT